MATPKYFSYFPNIKYSVEIDKAGHTTDINIKDYFHLLVVRGDIEKKTSLYNNYYVGNGQRPDQISYDVYGDEQYYWVILQVNGIEDYFNQWPLSSFEFEDYMVKKYGSERGAGEIRYYETVETKDNQGNIRLPGGLVVSKDYGYRYSESDDSSGFKYSYPREVSNWEHEYRINESKKSILILQPKYLNYFLRDIKNYGRRLETTGSTIDISEAFNIN